MPYAYSISGFTVEGRGPFPFDMLRHDQAWPVSAADAAALETASRRRIRLNCVQRGGPTAARWESFGWPIVSVE